MSEIICPVCGKSVTGMKCPNCSFPLAGVTAFADWEAQRAWNSAVNMMKDKRQSRVPCPGSLRIGDRYGAFIDPKTKCLQEWDTYFKITKEDGDYCSWSCSDGHYVRIRSDGRAEANNVGGGDTSETRLGSVTNAVDVVAANGATYIVDKDGRVRTFGNAGWTKETEKWTDIRMLTVGKNFIAGLTEAGTVRIASKSDYSAVSTLREITQIACTESRLLALNQKGRVLVCGENGVVAPLNIREAVAEVAANGKDENFLCLLKDNSVYAEGDYADAAKWRNVIAVAAASGLAAAVTSDRTILAVGKGFAVKEWNGRMLS